MLDIGEVTRQSGVAASTLRYYETIGLVAPVGRVGLRRQYAPEILERLALITLGKDAGFSLDEIGSMFAADGQLRIDRQILLDKADDLDALIRRLTVMSEGLRHTAACPVPNHMDCPSFIALVRQTMDRGTAR